MSIFSRHKNHAGQGTRHAEPHDYGQLLAATVLEDGAVLRAYTHGFTHEDLDGQLLAREWIDVARVHTNAEDMSLTVELVAGSTLVFTLMEESIAYVFRERIQDTFLGSVEREVVSPCDPGVQSALRGQLRRGEGKAYVDVYLDSIYVPYEEDLPIFVREAMDDVRRELSDEYALACRFRPARSRTA